MHQYLAYCMEQVRYGAMWCEVALSYRHVLRTIHKGYPAVARRVCPRVLSSKTKIKLNFYG